MSKLLLILLCIVCAFSCTPGLSHNASKEIDPNLCDAGVVLFESNMGHAASIVKHSCVVDGVTIKCLIMKGYRRAGISCDWGGK